MNNLYRILLRPRSFNVIQQQSNLGIRQLYNPSSIGMDDYVALREKYNTKAVDRFVKFREKMLDYSGEDDQKLVFTEDLKQMIHIAEPVEDDIALVNRMMLKFHNKNAHLRFGSYVFGPVVMRMYYFMNKPEEALKVYNDPQLDGFFDQLTSHVLLMDLLFKNGMYQEVVDVYNTSRQKQLTFGKFPKPIMSPLYAALYKLNTEESCNYMMQLWKEMQEMGHVPIRRMVCFAAALALNQNMPDVALEMVSSTGNQNFIFVRCIKALANNALGRMDEALIILSSVLTFDVPNGQRHTFPRDVLASVKENVEKQNNKILATEFNRIEKQLIDFDHVSDQTFDELLCSEINLINPVDKKRSVIRASFHDPGQQVTRHQQMFRPGLQEIV